MSENRKGGRLHRARRRLDITAAVREPGRQELGANCDLSHLSWQGCNPVQPIYFLGEQGAIFHAHVKDSLIQIKLNLFIFLIEC